MIVVYQAICALFAGLLAAAILRRSRLGDRVSGGTLLVILLLRIILAK